MNFVYFKADNPPKDDLVSVSSLRENMGMTRSMARRTADQLRNAGFPVYRLWDDSRDEAWNAKYSSVFYSTSDVLALKPSSTAATVRPPVLTTPRPPATTTPEPASKSIWDDAGLSKIEALYSQLLDEKESKLAKIEAKHADIEEKYETIMAEKEAKIEKIEAAQARERAGLERIISSLTNELSYFKNRTIKIERVAERAEKEIELLEAKASGIIKVPVAEDTKNRFTEGVQAPSPW